MRICQIVFLFNRMDRIQYEITGGFSFFLQKLTNFAIIDRFC